MAETADLSTPLRSGRDDKIVGKLMTQDTSATPRQNEALYEVRKRSAETE